MIDIDVSRRRLLTLFGGLAALNLIAIAGAYVARDYSGGHWLVREVVLQFSLTAENRVAVWYSAMLLLGASLAMTGCWLLDRRDEETGSARVLDLGWLFFAGVFALLSLDELGSLHERLAFGWLPKVQGMHGWTAFLILPIALMALLMLGFAHLRLRHRPLSAALMAVGALFFVTVPLQEHVEVGMPIGQRSPFLAVLEEGTELFGALAFLAAAAVYAASKASQRGPGGERRLSFALKPGVVAGVALLLAAGLAWAVILLPEVLALDDHRGVPQNWFPAAAAFLTALLAFSLAGRARAAGGAGAGRALLLLGVALLVLSADHGAAHHLTETLIAENAARRQQLDLLLMGGLSATAAVVVYLLPHRVTRLAVGLWWAAQVLAFLPGSPPRVVPAFVSYVLVAFALVRLARETAPGAASTGVRLSWPRSPSRAEPMPRPRAARRA